MRAKQRKLSKHQLEEHRVQSPTESLQSPEVPKELASRGQVCVCVCVVRGEWDVDRKRTDGVNVFFPLEQKRDPVRSAAMTRASKFKFK